jgi:hypothetical protein
MDSFPTPGNGGGYGGCFGGGSGGSPNPSPNPKPDNSHIPSAKTIYKKTQYTKDRQYYYNKFQTRITKNGKGELFTDNYEDLKKDFDPLYSKFNEFKEENPDLD